MTILVCQGTYVLPFTIGVSLGAEHNVDPLSNSTAYHI